MQIERIDTLERLAAVRDAWRGLLAESASASPFLTWDWLDAWWRRFGGRRQLRVLAGWSGGRLDLLAPYMARRRQISRGMLWTGLEPIGTGPVGADYLDILVRRDMEAVGVRALARYLDAERHELTAPRIHADAAQLRELAGRLSDAGWRFRSQTTPDDICPYVTLAGHSWASFVDSLGREHRANLRRRSRKLHERHRVRLLRAESDEQRDQFLEALVRLHRMRWSTRGGSTAFHTADLVAFHHHFTRRALAQGWLRLFVLMLDDSPAAALYGLRFGETFYFYQSGFDPRFAGEGVGLVLMGCAIEQAIAEGAAEFDFLHGREPYKFLWTAQARTLEHLELFPPTLSGRADHHLTELARVARYAMRRMATRAGSH
jgi:CelD/BcsL family acetyltransferase involved in cellulose biosynthesis